MPNVFTIPATCGFARTLAAGLWRRVGGDPLALASYVIYLPTRRACRALREAFLREAEAKAALLPRLQPLGDVDEVELDFADSAALADVPPAISPLRRQMLLTKLVLKKESSLPLEQAASLADSLGRLLDQAQIEGVAFDNLAKLVPDDYAIHWQETLRFLDIVTEAWPAILKEEGCIDLAARRAAVLDAQGAAWRRNPPDFPVIAAGSTGSVPAAARLMACIADLPHGEVILPGLDLTLEEEAWQVADETHPQFAMKHWLESLPLRRSAVKVWDGVETPLPLRAKVFSEIMRPAAVSEKWRELSAQEIPQEALRGVERLDLDHQREEADVVALRLRAALEEEGKTAALVTPDRALAARVASALARWGIEANDSAGSSLNLWPVGSFLNTVLAAAAPDASPVAYLSLLKHPLAAAGVATGECRQRAREVEIRVWRGLRRTGGWRGAARAVEDDENLSDWLLQLADLFAPVTDLWFQEKPLFEHLDAHIALAEALAASDAEPGAARLWGGQDGEAASSWLQDWREAAEGFPPLTGAAYARLFGALLQNVTVRPAYGAHPRLAILGPLEARLLHFDLIVLGGLNEGVWPPAPSVDPWLSRPMKRDFGLPSPERRVGLSAHDFVQIACSADEVFLTRARRAGGEPTVPSRFLSQMETVAQAVGLNPLAPPVAPWRAWARALDAADSVQPMAAPKARPPLAARPRRLSVTEIGTFKRNPYAIYAKHVLGLRKLEDIDADVTASEHGEVIHAALESFLTRWRTDWPADPLAALLDEGARAFAPYADRPQVKAFWWPRFARIAAWFIEGESSRRAIGLTPLAVEASGRLALGAFTLTGRADRIDALRDGRLAIIDYKTGAVPSKKMVLSGYEPQLALLALMAARGAFPGVPAAQAGELAYWHLKGGQEVAKIESYVEALSDQIAKAEEGLNALLEKFADPTTPYEAVPKPDYAPRFDDYAHLARLAEWGRVEGDEA